MRTLVWLILALLISSVAVHAEQSKGVLKYGEPFYPYVQNQCLVMFKDGVTLGEQQQSLSQIRGHSVYHSELLGFHRVELNGTTPLEAVKTLRENKSVEWANFDYKAEACYIPNDTFYEYQWHLSSIGLESAWNITRGSSDVIVAVADQGFQFNHEDWTSVQTASPYDFVDDDNNPQIVLEDSHGMHVAGTIFATTNNNLGVAGIAPLCRLMPIRVLDDSGSGSASWIADGIAWAASHNADVLNLSLGFEVDGPPQNPGPPLSTAITTAANAGVVICAATGNDGQPYVGYPAAYPQCIAVGATALNDAIAPYSNQGTAIDVVAPGGNTNQDLNSDGYDDGVLSTVRGGDGDDYYVFWQGTSMAAPHVSGVAALLISNGLPASDVLTALQETALDLGSTGWDAVFGYGRINAYAALQWTSGGNSETLILTDGLNSWPPPQWTLSSTGAEGAEWEALAGNSGAGNGTATHSGANAAFHDDEDVDGISEDWLITPETAIPANALSATLRFWQRNYYLPSYYLYHGVWYSTTWPTFYEIDELDEPSEEWEQKTYDVSEQIGESVYFAFQYEGDYATEWYIDDVELVITVPNAAEEIHLPLPLSTMLLPPYPNPFNAVTTIPFEISTAGVVNISITDILGRQVATLLPGQPLNAGRHVIPWDATEFSSGSYFVQLQTAGNTTTRKIILLK